MEKAQIRQAAATTRLALLRKGKRVVKDAVWPGLDLACKLVVLSCSEVADCHAEAVGFFARKKIPLDMFSVQLFQDEQMTQLLFRGVRDPEDVEKPFAESADDLRENLDVDQRAAMFDIYRDFQLSIDPSPDEMDQELLKEIIELLKKKDETGWRAFGPRTLWRCLLTMANPPSTSPTGS